MKLNAREVAALSAEDARSWIDSITIGRTSSDQEFDWEDLAVLAEHRAKAERSLIWSSIAIRSYEALATVEDKDSAGYLQRAVMQSRVTAILLFGVKTGHDILDPRAVCEWCRQLIGGLSLDVAAEMSRPERAEQLQTEEFLRIRKIKNALNILEPVPRAALLSHPDLIACLDAKDNLV